MQLQFDFPFIMLQAPDHFHLCLFLPVIRRFGVYVQQFNL